MDQFEIKDIRFTAQKAIKVVRKSIIHNHGEKIRRKVALSIGNICTENAARISSIKQPHKGREGKITPT